jgi:oligopeptide/dipeptide ABC transporter ATP-binding protein
MDAELVSHKVAVMYLGKIVEMGLSGRIATRASNPYTHILWSSLTEEQSREAHQRAKRIQAGKWGVLDFEWPIESCRFAPRCPVSESQGKPDICINAASEPALREIEVGRQVACHFPL